METAIKFERWDFLEAHFNEGEEKVQWSRAKEDKLQTRPVLSTSSESRLFALSRQFPMFNDKAIPSFKMEGVINYR